MSAGPPDQAALVLGVALRDLAGRKEGVTDPRNVVRAAHRVSERRLRIGAAHDVELRPRRIVVPAQQQDVRQPLGMVRVHMREEDRVELSGGDAELGQPLIGPASGVELQPNSIAIVGIIAVANQCARPRLTVGDRRPALHAGQCHDEARRGMRGRRHPQRGDHAAGDQRPSQFMLPPAFACHSRIGSPSTVQRRSSRRSSFGKSVRAWMVQRLSHIRKSPSCQTCS